VERSQPQNEDIASNLPCFGWMPVIPYAPRVVLRSEPFCPTWIAEARGAVLDRIEDGFSKSHQGEQLELRGALQTLSRLRRMAERKQWRTEEGWLMLSVS
jgi:hypothetical protein